MASRVVHVLKHHYCFVFVLYSSQCFYYDLDANTLFLISCYNQGSLGLEIKAGLDLDLCQVLFTSLANKQLQKITNSTDRQLNKLTDLVNLLSILLLLLVCVSFTIIGQP